MKIYFLISVVVSTANIINGQVFECDTPDGGAGLCKHLTQCPDLLSKAYSIKLKRVSKEIEADIANELRFKKYLCSDKDKNAFCCDGDCTTPDGHSGVIKDIRECPYLMTLLAGKKRSDLIYVSRSRINKTTKACCGSPSSDVLVKRTNEECDALISTPPDATSGCCGVDASDSARIIGENVTELAKYPWTVLLEYYYGKNQQVLLNCGGSLISSRHVVTAARCISQNQAGQPKRVRIGELQVNNTGRDCRISPDGSQECTDGALFIPIESFIVHSMFRRSTGFNDIGLIKLANSVRYTDFVRPICLPSSDLSKRAGDTVIDLEVAGWGEGTGKFSNFKLATKVQFVNMQDCQNAYKYRVWNGFHRLWEKQVCAGGDSGTAACRGEGGALMAEVEKTRMRFRRYELIGVASYDLRRCGARGLPGVYTNVYLYLDWIRHHLRNESDEWVGV